MREFMLKWQKPWFAFCYLCLVWAGMQLPSLREALFVSSVVLFWTAVAYKLGGVKISLFALAMGVATWLGFAARHLGWS